jgi:S-DNA-T family DNA segregation ATPase FtsK/SpoIIIE
MSEQTKTSNKDMVSVFSVIVGVIGGFVIRLVWSGLTRRSTWDWARWQRWLVYLIVAVAIIYAPGRNLGYWMSRLTWIFPAGLGLWVESYVPRWLQFGIVFVLPLLTWLAAIGAKSKIKVHRFQKALGHMDLKGPSGLSPIVVDVVPMNPGHTKIIVKAVGFDVAELKNKKTVLESSLNLFVQDIRVTENNRQLIEIRASDRLLPTLIPFDEVSDQLAAEPFSFLIGEGMSGFMTSSLLKVNHMLVAGATGGGKSFFVKQLLIGLLESSEHLQLYLLDLKRGVEMKVFEKLENVSISKDPVNAIETLKIVVREMNRRFEYLEKTGLTAIDCKRDKLDRIVVLVDEASELFTVGKSSKTVKASAESARELADKIAKLGRVAGIHLILATQKVVKETIDTRVQLNIDARMIFRVNTTAGSITVLGSKLAADLPEIKGRGIWSVGGQHLTVQTPKLDNEEVTKKVKILTEKFNGEESPLLQQMLITKRAKTSPAQQNTPNTPEVGVNVSTGSF